MEAKRFSEKLVKYKNLQGAISQRDWNIIVLIWWKTFEYFSTNKVNINKLNINFVNISGNGRFFPKTVTAVGGNKPFEAQP
jgi:hypothetical protein